MDNHYQYRCFSCGLDYLAEEIEQNLRYLCPRCGCGDKNQPLVGVLQIEYDYPSLARQIVREDFLCLPVGEMWRYPQLWPLEFDARFGKLSGVNPLSLSGLALPANQLLRTEIEGKTVLVLDDTRNPTLSYKDRASILVALKALQSGIGEIAAASTGNAGSSLAGICARLGLQAHLFVPVGIPTAKRLQIQAYGARIYLVEGDYDTAFDLSLEISRAKGWYNRNTAYNPLTIEGKKSAAYDIFISTQGNLPDTIFVPVGDGVILSGIYKGFWELRKLGWIEKLPRLIAVQAAGSNALVRYLQTEEFKFQPAHTVADSISAGAPRNLFMAAHAVRESGGEAISVPDEEILQAQRTIAREMGILTEPAAAVSLAGYLRFRSLGKMSPDEKILLMFTGNGLKDASALERWNPVPPVRTPKEWKEELGIG